MLFNSYSYEILYEQFRCVYLQGDIKLLLVTVNNRLKFEIEIVHDLSCHPIFRARYLAGTHKSLDAAIDTHHSSRGAEARQQAQYLGGETLYLPVGVLQKIDQAHDAAELFQRHADALARTHLTEDLKRSDLQCASHSSQHSRLLYFRQPAARRFVPLS